MTAEHLSNPTPASSRTKVSPAFVSALYLIIIYLTYTSILRVANFITLVRTGSTTISPLGPPFTLPFILGEELIIGSLFALTIWISWRHRLFRTLWLNAFGIYLLFLAFDQLAYKYFFSHIDYLLYSSSHDLLRLWSSIAASFDAFFAVAVILAIAFSVLLFLPYRPRFIGALAALLTRRPLASTSTLLAYIAATYTLAALSDQHGLIRSFPVTYVSSYLKVQAEERDVEKAALELASATGYPSVNRPVPDRSPADDDLKTARTAIAAFRGKLNIVWYLMESVSYRETSLVTGNRYDTTPFLKELSKKSLLFTDYYVNWAASTRSFFSSLTGLFPYIDKAPDITKYSKLSVPNLVDILHDAGYTTAFFSSSDTLFDSLDTYLANRAYDIYVDKNLLSKEDQKSSS